MTEPTWKDPLLQLWAKDCALETLRYLGGDHYHLSPVAMLDTIDAMPARFLTDRDRLRSLIDTELAGGRRARARAMASGRALDSYDEGRVEGARDILEAFDGE